jgi:hypothetical protein
MACEEFQERMLDVLYGEAGAAAARAWDDHQQRCEVCREEMRGLRRVRRDLGAWTAPAPRGRAVAWGRPQAWLPLAAALALALAGAVTLVAAQRRVDRLADALQAQDERHRAEIAALKTELTAARGGEETLAEVRRLLRESEARQSVVLDASLRGLADRSDAQRREDLAQVSAGFSYLEGRTGLQVARTTELMGHVLQASQRK